MSTTTPGEVQGCRCEMLNERRRYCGAEPVAVFVTGCKYEHLSEEPLCAVHAGMSARRELWCCDCWRVGVYVRAVMLAKILPSGEVVRVLQS